MSPRRRSPGPPDGQDHRTALDALRAQMEAAAQMPKAGRRTRRGPPAGPGRRGLGPVDGLDGDVDVPGDEGVEEPVPEAPTPLDEPEGTRGGRWWDDHPGKPIPVDDGIAATTRRGPIGATWWSRRFLASLEAVLVGGRMERGRSYARKGQVVSLAVRPGAVVAVVQGSRPEPYRVRLAMPVVADEEWERIIVTLGSQARFAARLLAGELPHEVEDVFEATGASLFPAPHARLVTECTCPDFENPCKHIAAVCYLVAELFDRDPFRVLEWRGRDRAAVVDALRALRSAGEPTPASAPAPAAPAPDIAGAGAPDPAAPAPDGAGAGAPPTEAELSPEGFWAAGPGLSDVHVRPVAAFVPDAVLRQLPRDLVRVRGRDLADVLSAAYEAFTTARRAGR